MKQVKTKIWFFKRKTYLNINSDRFSKSSNKIRSILVAILCGFIIGSIFIMTQNANPILVIIDIFRFAFEDWGARILQGYYSSLDKTLTWWAVYIIIGLAMIVSFKTGMFNIGVPGQMLLPGALTIIIGIRFQKINQFASVTMMLILGIFLGAIIAMIAGFLKAFFNIHEVLTTIMLNWFIWFLVRWIFTTDSTLMKSDLTGVGNTGNNMSLDIDGRIFILALILACIALIITWVLLKKTVFGYKLQAVGTNKDCANYSGVNTRSYAIIAMGFSGALAGLGGVVYYLYLGKDIKIYDTMMPLIGFDSIAIALVAGMSIFGTVGSALLWAILKQGAISAAGVNNISNQVATLLFGIIIYMTSISILFLNYHPYLFVKKMIIIWKDQDSWLKYKKFNNEIKILKKASNKKNNHQIEINKALIKNLKNERLFFINEAYEKYLKSGKRGIRSKYFMIRNIIFAFAVDKYINVQITKNNKILALKNDYYKELNKLKYLIKLNKLKQKYLLEFNEKPTLIELKNQIKNSKKSLNLQYKKDISIIKKEHDNEFESIYNHEKIEIVKNKEGLNNDFKQYLKGGKK